MVFGASSCNPRRPTKYMFDNSLCLGKEEAPSRLQVEVQGFRTSGLPGCEPYSLKRAGEVPKYTEPWENPKKWIHFRAP